MSELIVRQESDIPEPESSQKVNPENIQVGDTIWLKPSSPNSPAMSVANISSNEAHVDFFDARGRLQHGKFNLLQLTKQAPKDNAFSRSSKKRNSR